MADAPTPFLGNVGIVAGDFADFTTLLSYFITPGGTTAAAKGLEILGKSNDGTPQYQPMPLGAGGRSLIVEPYTSGSGNATGAMRVELPTNGTGRVTAVQISDTAPSFIEPIAASYVADDAETNSGTPYTLDLTQKSGVWLYCAIGRQAATALTRSAYIAVRPTLNGSSTIRIAGTNLDFASSTAAVGSTTLNGATNAGDTSATLTSATTFAVGDWVCFSSPDTSGLRVEFARIRKISSNTLTFEQPLKIAHNNADRVTSAADLSGRLWIPGGDIYHVYGVNNSGQAVIFQAEAATVA